MTIKSQKLQEIHEESLIMFDAVQSAVWDERMQCLEDRRFYSISGAQWEGALGEQFANKPRFEANKIHLAVIRIINEYRNNRITVDFVSKDGSKNSTLADTCNGLFRADEQDSGAEEAYDNAFEEAVGGGFGAVRLRTCYEDEEDDENEEQRIRIEPIFDADSCVFFDLGAKRQDKADATRCWVLTSMTYDAYFEEYGEDPAAWPKDINQSQFDWITSDSVYVAEYYVVEMKKETIHVFKGLMDDERKHTATELQDDDGELLKMLEATGFKEVRTKKIKTRRVHKYIMSGAGILEDCGYIAGKCIPVAPMFGKRWFVDNIERCMGHVRLAKDSQRLGNMQRSKLAEITALSPIEKPMVTPEQISGHQVMWAEDNLKNNPYLLINPITDANGNMQTSGPVGYTKPPAIPPAMAALLQITEQDMKDLLGDQSQADKMVSGISGKAVEMIQTRVDMQTFIYMSNMAKMVRRIGEIWLSMAKDVYVEEGRKLKTIDSMEQTGSVELMVPKVGEDGEDEYENDLSAADFDVVVDVGPSSSSRRESTVRSLMGMMSITQDPEVMSVLQSMAMMNMEGEGIADVRDYFRSRMVKAGVIKPNEEEQKQMTMAAQNQQPDANTVYLQAAAEEATAKAGQAKANTVKTIADAELSQARTMETLENIDSQEQENAMKIIETFGKSAEPESVSAVIVNPDAAPTQPL